MIVVFCQSLESQAKSIRVSRGWNEVMLRLIFSKIEVKGWKQRVAEAMMFDLRSWYKTKICHFNLTGKEHGVAIARRLDLSLWFKKLNFWKVDLTNKKHEAG